MGGEAGRLGPTPTPVQACSQALHLSFPPTQTPPQAISPSSFLCHQHKTTLMSLRDGRKVTKEKTKHSRHRPPPPTATPFPRDPFQREPKGGGEGEEISPLERGKRHQI